MSRKEAMKELYEKVDRVKPLAEKDGKVYVTFEDAATLNSYNSTEPKTGAKLLNPDGSLASTGKMVQAINPDYFFANRYRVKGKKMWLVAGFTTDGYRAIKEQASGHIFTKTIPAFVMSRNADGDVEVEKVATVSDAEFIADFTSVLDNKTMAEILPMLTKYGDSVSTTEMPI